VGNISNKHLKIVPPLENVVNWMGESNEKLKIWMLEAGLSGKSPKDSCALETLTAVITTFIGYGHNDSFPDPPDSSQQSVHTAGLC